MTYPTSLNCGLSIKCLELFLFLGVSAKEQQERQRVTIDISISCKEFIKGGMTDQLEDTTCYATLIEGLKNTIISKRFQLLEHLGFTIYKTLKSLLPPQAEVNVTVTKVPPIQEIVAGVTFSCGDKLP